jgi:hypothetical protein
VTISLETQLAPAGTAQQLVVSTVQVTGTVNVYAITAILNLGSNGRSDRQLF